MGITDTYKELHSQKMIKVFTQLHDVNEQIRHLTAQKKELESQYKPEIEKSFTEDLYLKTPNGLKLSIKQSKRKGGWNQSKLSTLIEANEMDEVDFRNQESTVYTLRFEKED